MNRALLKQDAKDAMRLANPHPVLTTLILLVVFIALYFVMGVVVSVFSLTEFIFGYGSASVFGMSIAAILNFVIGLVMLVVIFGYVAYSLRVFKQEDTGIHELFAYFPMLLKIIGLTLWIALFTMLWSCLCVIPGIIAGLRYSQSYYVLAENPDMSIRDCVNESKALMSGRLWEFFVLQLSFIPWILLSYVTCGIAFLYVCPYMQTTLAGYYLSLKPYDTYNGYDTGYQDGYADGYNAGGGYANNSQF